MCRKVRCPKCGRATFAGCGAHVEQVLADVPNQERCQCAPHTKRAGPLGLTAWLVVGVAVALSAFLVTRSFALAGPPPMDPHALVAAGALLLDVRTAEEFAEGHIPGAVNVPVQQLETRMHELGSKSRPIVVYCRSGVRSARTARLLSANGFASVHDIGAMSSW